MRYASSEVHTHTRLEEQLSALPQHRPPPLEHGLHSRDRHCCEAAQPRQRHGAAEQHGHDSKDNDALARVPLRQQGLSHELHAVAAADRCGSVVLGDECSSVHQQLSRNQEQQRDADDAGHELKRLRCSAVSQFGDER